jgi:hypothetical protein
MTTTRSRGPNQDQDAGLLRLVPGGAAQHPSYLALDRAALGSRTAALSRHLAECERCRAHVDRIAEPVALPSGLEFERRAQRAPVERRPPAARAWLSGLAAAATVALLLIAVLTGRERNQPVRPAGGDTVATEDGFDTEKGGRAVGVYVLRGRHTFLWNGAEPVEPGDALRLKLVPDGMTQVHVFSQSGARDLVLLHRARVAPDRDSLLDTAWKVDGVGEREVLVVVLSAEALSLSRAQAAAREGGMGEDVWVARLILPKRPASEEVPR